MTDLTRPIAGDPLSSSNGKASTVILDEAFDVIEANEDALAARTSSTIITTDPYTDITEVTLNTAESLTGWYATNTSGSLSDPGPSLNATHSQGTTSVQALLSTNAAAKLYVNLTEAGYASGLDVTPGQHILMDVYLAEQLGASPGTGMWTRWNFSLASGVDMTGTVVSVNITSATSANYPLGTWHTISVPVGALTNIRSIGITKLSGSGTYARWHIDNVRRAAQNAISQAFFSAADVTVVVPSAYVESVEPEALVPTSLKSLVDFRPSHAVISGLGGFKNTREWGLDETGVVDVGAELQEALDSLSPGDVLEMPPHAIYRCDRGIVLNVPNLTIDGHGAALTQAYPDDLGLFDGTNKVATSENARIEIAEEANGATLRNLRIFGASINVQLGNAFTAAGGAAVVGTTMVLDALNENASHLNVPGRDPLGRTYQTLVLSDTNHVANDCVVTCTDEDGVVLSTTTIPLLTSTPTAYTIYNTPRSIWSGHTVKVNKATATANQITLTQMRTYNRCQTSWVGNASNGINYEFAHGIMVSNATNVTIEDVVIEGNQGDGIWLNNSLPTTGNKGVTVRRLLVRGNGRQSLALCGGSHHVLQDCYLLYAGRHGVDFEPEFPATSANDGIDIFNMVCWKCNLADGFQTSSTNAFARNKHIMVDGLKVYSENGGGIKVGFMESSMTNVEMIALSGVAQAIIVGRNMTIDHFKCGGTLALGATGAATSDDTNGVPWTATNVQAKNVVFTTAVLGEPYLQVLQIGAHLENIRVSDAITVDQNYAINGIKLAADTTYTGIDFPPYRALLPNSYPGVAIGQAWFPGGLDLRTEPLSRVRSLSGGTSKGNNLGRFQETVTAAATSKTIVFPAKTYPSTTVTTLGQTTGGSMALGLYHYRIAARNRFGGPVVPTVDQTVTLSGSNTAVNILIDNLYSTLLGMTVEGVTIYRGPVGGVSGNYTTRYDIIPTGELVGWGGGGSGTNKRVGVTDLGASLIVPAGSAAFFQGYTFPYASTTGPGTATLVDETGYEVDTNYAVFVEPSWQTTWRISARRRDGFDIEFGVPAPTGTNTLSWMIARF